MIKTKLAIILHKVHEKMQLQPFYTWDGVTEYPADGTVDIYNWDSLSEFDEDPEKVSKEFFLKIAEYIIKSTEILTLTDILDGINYNDERITFFAVLLSKIHSYSLEPFYESDESDVNLWETIPEKTDNTNDVDKEFFRKLAFSILKSLQNLGDNT